MGKKSKRRPEKQQLQARQEQQHPRPQQRQQLRVDEDECPWPEIIPKDKQPRCMPGVWMSDSDFKNLYQGGYKMLRNCKFPMFCRSHIEKGGPRVRADFLLLRYYARPDAIDDPWLEQRIHAFAFYYHDMQGMFLNETTEDDWNFLRDIRRNKYDNETALLRFAAFELTGKICISSSSPAYLRDDALKYFDEASHICEETLLDEELKSRTIRWWYSGEVPVEVGTIMERARDCYLSDLRKICTGKPSTRVVMMPQGNKIRIPELAGYFCDVCGVSRDELAPSGATAIDGGLQASTTATSTTAMHTIMSCAKCHMAYYCSPECQRKGWIECQHKEVCRHSSKKQYRPGDTAYAMKSIRFEEMNINIQVGDVVQIVGQYCCEPKQQQRQYGGQNRENSRSSHHNTHRDGETSAEGKQWGRQEHYILKPWSEYDGEVSGNDNEIDATFVGNDEENEKYQVLHVWDLKRMRTSLHYLGYWLNKERHIQADSKNQNDAVAALFEEVDDCDTTAAVGGLFAPPAAAAADYDDNTRTLSTSSATISYYNRRTQLLT